MMQKQIFVKLILLTSILCGLLIGCAGEQNNASEQAAATIKNISVNDAHELLQKEKDVILIDVRTWQEWHGPLGRIAGAQLKPVQEINTWMPEYESAKGKTIVMMCRSGNRSGRAAKTLLAAGFTSVINVEGGMMAWNVAGLPVEKSPDQH